MIKAIVEQHASDAAFLWLLRETAAGDPHFDLADLSRLDGRVEANLDGLRVAGEEAWPICSGAAGEGDAGEMFVAAAVALDLGNFEGLAGLLDLCSDDSEEAADRERGLKGALAWTDWEHVSEILPGLLAADCPPRLQELGIAACAAHRMDPGQALDYAFYSSDLRVRATALRAAGFFGRAMVAKDARASLSSEDPACRFSAAWSMTLAGEGDALPVLWEYAERGGALAKPALEVALRRAGRDLGLRWLHSLASTRAGTRSAIKGAGMLGDAELVPWLIDCMQVPELARVAAESFVLITGASMDGDKLRGEKPEGFEPGPNDDPNDPNVDMDEDENLPWPEQKAVRAWWARNRGRITPGVRHLLGRPVTDSWGQQVLRKGLQRQRAGAALELALLSPGRTLFEVRAPAFRQVRLLGAA